MATIEKPIVEPPADNSEKKLGYLSKVLTFLKDHYTSLAAAFIVIFTGLCLFISIAFYQEFGIEITYFSSFLDIYKTAFSNQSWKITGFTIFFVICFLAAHSAVNNNKEAIKSSLLEIQLDRIPKITPTRRLSFFDKVMEFIYGTIVPLLAIFGFPALFIFALVSLPSALSNHAKYIKQGVATRYDLRTIDQTYKCQAVLGASSDYLFIWNYETAQAKIIPRIKINEINLVLIVPDRQAPSNSEKIPPKERAQILKEIKQEHDQWIKDLYTRCKQVSPPPRL